MPFKYENKIYNSSFFPNTLKLWNNLPQSIQTKDVKEFKISINSYIKPKRYKFFSCGSKLGNKLLTQIRVGRSHLKQHKFTIGLAESPVCQCFYPSETTEHYFLQCFLYSPERRILFDLIEHHVPNFLHFNNKQKIDILLNGIRKDDPDLFYLNKTLTIAVQQFIIATKRFVD